MPDTAKLSIQVDASAVDAASAAFDRLAQSIERASKALEGLNSADHGGIRVEAVGEIVQITIDPKS